jgi:hypothetical protein
MEVAASAGTTQANACSTGCSVDNDVKPKLQTAIKAEEEHQLRLLYTRESQWWLMNTQAGPAISSQTMCAMGAEVSGWMILSVLFLYNYIEQIFRHDTCADLGGWF